MKRSNFSPFSNANCDRTLQIHECHLVVVSAASSILISSHLWSIHDRHQHPVWQCLASYCLDNCFDDTFVVENKTVYRHSHLAYSTIHLKTNVGLFKKRYIPTLHPFPIPLAMILFWSKPLKRTTSSWGQGHYKEGYWQIIMSTTDRETNWMEWNGTERPEPVILLNRKSTIKQCSLCVRHLTGLRLGLHRTPAD